jgi:hypothetical protein
MQTTTFSQSFLTAGPRVVENSRGSAHPQIPTTRPTAPRNAAVVKPR